MKSLLLKLGMLVVTVGIVLWIGWMRHASVETLDGSMQEQTTASLSRSPHDGRAPHIDPIVPATVPQLERHRLLDLNRADADELERLPGIGAVLAQRVIAFRASVGRFRKIEELRAVKGIGAKKFDRLKSFVTVSIRNSQRETEQGHS